MEPGTGAATPEGLAPAGSEGTLGGAADPAAGLSAGAVGMLPSDVDGGGPPLHVSGMSGSKKIGKSSLLKHIHVRTLGVFVVQVLIPMHTELGLIACWCCRRDRDDGYGRRRPNS